MIKSISSGLIPALLKASRPAAIAKSDVASLSAAILRSLIPVQVRIHSSVVLTIFSKSKLVKIFSGT